MPPLTGPDSAGVAAALHILQSLPEFAILRAP